MAKNLIDITFSNSTNNKTWKDGFFDDVIGGAISFLKLKGQLSVGVHLVGEARIKSLNKEHREKNKVTDVLSFPIGQECDNCGIIDLGDIFISLPVAIKDSEKSRVKTKSHLATLSIHGFLHLLGYDHEKSIKDSEKMFDLQKKILNSINLGD